MPVFNAEKTITKAIDLFKKLTKLNLFETKLIIIDDFSNDATVNLVKALEDKNIKIVKNLKNIGPGGSRNKALNYIKDGYIGFLDADDQLSVENYARSLIDGYKANNDIVIASSNYYGEIVNQLKDIGVSLKRIRPNFIL